MKPKLIERPRNFIVSLKKYGIWKTLQVSYSFFVDCWFDRKYQVDTLAFVELVDMDIEEEKKPHSSKYQPTQGLPLRKLFKRLNFPPGMVFVDLGCGKGRVLLIASEFGFKEVIGVEHSLFLCKIAAENCKKYQQRQKTKTEFTICHSDVRDYPFKDEEKVFFLYNPFDASIMQSVLESILSSLRRRNRKIWILSQTAVHRQLIETVLTPRKVSSLTLRGLDFVVFEIG